MCRRSCAASAGKRSSLMCMSGVRGVVVELAERRPDVVVGPVAPLVVALVAVLLVAVLVAGVLLPLDLQQASDEVPAHGLGHLVAEEAEHDLAQRLVRPALLARDLVHGAAEVHW